MFRKFYVRVRQKQATEFKSAMPSMRIPSWLGDARVGRLLSIKLTSLCFQVTATPSIQ
jgi:hypothetical protein